MASPWYIYTHWVKNFVLFFFFTSVENGFAIDVKSKGTKNTLLFTFFLRFKFKNNFSFTYSGDQTIERLP